ncbi:MAG: Nif3-like dinuclear metal center hexameric protein [Roseivirga sp.]|nr:Nif3-like dinuclear metal center hexameric protein [Roseivirga sp.]
MAKVKDIVRHLESIAPPSLQESYDNASLITGSASMEVKGVLITLDCIESVIDEAIERDCNMIVAHHPIVFRGLKQLNGKNYVERTIIQAIKNDIAIYAIHTNLDNVISGVNRKICEKLGLENVKILAPKKGTLQKLVTFIPVADSDEVIASMHQAGAGNIGNYSDCSFRVTGTGYFKPNQDANPTIGTSGELEEVEENRVEVVYPKHLQGQVLNALKSAHPYEEVAYYISDLENSNQEVGSGMIGDLPIEMTANEFLYYLKDKMDLNTIRYTEKDQPKIKKVAVCGGAGSFLLGRAKSRRADAFVTADFKYHEFFDAEGQIMIADIGHYESEIFTKELLHSFLTEKFANIATCLSRVDTNPVKYF